MKAIILAAGQGSRLMPLTSDRPKCMVKVFGKPMIDYQLQALRGGGVDQITVVSGYKHDVLRTYLQGRVEQLVWNEKYQTTNMVISLLEGLEAIRKSSFRGDLILSYSDIIYPSELCRQLIQTDGEIVVAADLEWEKLWRMRMEDPLSDAETFRMDSEGKITEIGKKPKTLEEVQAQYIGLLKIRSHKIEILYQILRKLEARANQLYMTDLIQMLIDQNWEIKASLFEGGWLEVDSIEDLRCYQSVAGDELQRVFSSGEGLEPNL